MFSIIIPAYNCAGTISKTVDSILHQTHGDFELIVVNDGSTDDTGDVLAEIAERDGRVRIYTVPNAGPAQARNLGMEHAAGALLMFVDSDDTLADGALAFLAQETALYEADVYLFGHIIVDATGQKMGEYHIESAYGPSQALLPERLPRMYRANLLHQIWNKVYRTPFIHKHHLRMQDYRYGEDRLFVFDVLRHCRQIYITDRHLYYYVNNPNGSLITNYYDRKFECCCLIDDRIRELGQAMHCDKKASDPVWHYMYLKSAVSCLVNLYHTSCTLNRTDKREIAKKILSHPKTKQKIKLNASMGWKVNWLQKIMHSRILWLNLWMAKSIALVMQNDLKRFVRAKHR